jgi:hypothetical protein
MIEKIERVLVVPKPIPKIRTSFLRNLQEKDGGALGAATGL